MTECFHRDCTEPAVIRIDIPPHHVCFACVYHREQAEFAVHEGNKEGSRMGWNDQARIVVLDQA